jgi:hypothetical protein
MRGLVGLVLVSAGAAWAGYGFPLPDLERSLNGVRTVVASVETLTTATRSGGDGQRTFSPQKPLFTPVASTAEEPAGRSQPAAPARGESPVATIERSPQPLMKPGNSPIVRSAQVPTSAPAADARHQLVRDLQRELRRVGCFDAEIDGDWNAATKRALTLFMDRINATLPLDQPDYILLTLVQGHATQACGKNCPSGQAIGADGRCLPAGVVAKAERGRQVPPVKVTVAPQPAPVAVEPVAVAPRPAPSAAPAAGERTKIAASETRPPPVPAPSATWTTTVVPSSRVESVPTRSAEAPPVTQVPLPGRMTLGKAPPAGPAAVPPTGNGSVKVSKAAPVDEPQPWVTGATTSAPSMVEPVPTARPEEPYVPYVPPTGNGKSSGNGSSGGGKKVAASPPPSRDWKRNIFSTINSR